MSGSLFAVVESTQWGIEMPIQNISITNHFDEFIESQVKEGKFQDASEAVNAGLRLLERQTQKDAQKLEILKKLVAEGMEASDRGEGVAITGKKELADFIADIGNKVRKRSAKRARN